MDGWLKILIAAACVVVISGGGYYAWSEYQASKRREVAQEAANERFCRQMIRDLSRDQVKEYKGAHIAGCINQKYVTELDFQEAGVIGYVDNVRTLINPQK